MKPTARKRRAFNELKPRALSTVPRGVNLMSSQPAHPGQHDVNTHPGTLYTNTVNLMTCSTCTSSALTGVSPSYTPSEGRCGGVPGPEAGSGRGTFWIMFQSALSWSCEQGDAHRMIPCGYMTIIMSIIWLISPVMIPFDATPCLRESLGVEVQVDI